MGRIAGVSAAETRERLLHAAADVFADRGYDGTRVADIAAAAGVTRGAMYAHFGSKAELLVCALRMHGRRVLAEMFAAGPDRSFAELLVVIGWGLRLRDGPGYLIVEALVAARRDKEVAVPMGHYVSERAKWLGELMCAAQAGDEIDPALSPNALAHLCLLLAMGSALVTPDVHAVDDGEWATLLSRLRVGLALLGTTAQKGNTAVKLLINPHRCQGHGRCYYLAPDLFGDDEEGYGQILSAGAVPQDKEREARLAVANCPERAIDLFEQVSHDSP